MNHDYNNTNYNMNLSSSSSSSASEDEHYYSSNDEDIQEKLKNNGSSSIGNGIDIDAVDAVDAVDTFDDEDIDNDDLNEFDEIDWEDGHQEEEEEEDEEETTAADNVDNNIIKIDNHNNVHHKQVQQQKSQSSIITTRKNNSNLKRKRKRQFNKIPISSSTHTHIHALLHNIQKSHLLTLTSRCMFHSLLFVMNNNNNNIENSNNNIHNNEGDDDDCELLHIAYSLIPMEFIEYSSECNKTFKNNDDHNHHHHHYVVIPNKMMVTKFSKWFFQYVNHCQEKRQKTLNLNITAGAKQITRKNNKRKKKRKDILTHPDETATKRQSKRFKNDHNKNIAENRVDDDDVHTMKYNNNGMILHQRLLTLFKFISFCNSEDPNIYDDHDHVPLDDVIISPLEKTMILLCMMRSMGWKVRYVNALDPISSDLTVDHPLFSLGIKDVLKTIMDSTVTNTKSSKKNKTSKTTTITSNNNINNTRNIVNSNDVSAFKYDEYPWVEVLTKKSDNHDDIEKTNKSVMKKESRRWVHVDPHFELIDKPSYVEYIRGQKYKFHNVQITKPVILKKNSRMKPISYVIAVEHNYNTTVNTAKTKSVVAKITDVSPRYANMWSKTLRLRGASARDIEKSGGNCSNIWWSKTIRKVNKHFSGRSKTNRDTCSTSGSNSGSNRKSSKFVVEKKETGEEILIIDDSSDDEKNSKIMEKKQDVEYEDDVAEAEELKSSKNNEAIPTSKKAFKNHPLYVIPSVLKSQEVLSPDSKKRVCGMFKGELVYKRSDVSTAQSTKKWLYDGRQVRESELSKPVKKIKKRKKPAKKGFQALIAYGGRADETQADLLTSLIEKGDFKLNDDDENDAMINLYGIWQTDPWSPPYIGPNDMIIVNEHKNVELALLNPGLVHLDLPRISVVAKKLSIPYAPCLLGFEGHGGNRTPTIRGIVIHEHNADLLREAHTEYESQLVEDECKKKQDEIVRRWKRLVNGVLTAERLRKEYEKA